MTTIDFDIDALPARPLTARVATNGATVRPTWYSWEEHTFWILAGHGASLVDIPRGRHKLDRYLGPDETRWDVGYPGNLHEDSGERGTVWPRSRPVLRTTRDLSHHLCSSRVRVRRQRPEGTALRAITSR